MSKRIVFLVLAFGLLGLEGCPSQSVGQRCQASSDCNADTDSCRAEFDRVTPCAGGMNCICCPTDRATAQGISVCAPATPSGGDAGGD